MVNHDQQVLLYSVHVQSADGAIVMNHAIPSTGYVALSVYFLDSLVPLGCSSQVNHVGLFAAQLTLSHVVLFYDCMILLVHH